MNTEEIKNRLTMNGIPFNDDLPEKLMIYHSLLNEWNRRIDLTAVKEDDETVDRHFIDSLTVLKTRMIGKKASLIDVGTGAGFPGMVIAMARPDLQVALLDSQQKRLSFLEKVSDETDIRNISIIHERAEDGAHRPELREHFDYAVARALAPLNVLCEYLLPYVTVEGYVLCWKGPALKDELESGRKAAQLLGGRIGKPEICELEGRDWKHMILPIQKIQHTDPAYPRKAGIPKKKPLGI